MKHWKDFVVIVVALAILAGAVIWHEIDQNRKIDRLRDLLYECQIQESARSKFWTDFLVEAKEEGAEVEYVPVSAISSNLSGSVRIRTRDGREIYFQQDGVTVTRP